MKIRSLFALAVLAFAPYASHSEEKPLPPNTVVIDNFSFTPQTLVVQAGTKVTWINRDDVPHTVVAEDKQFKSRPLDTDEAFSCTFTNAGTNAYFCSIHAHMTGTIIVVGPAAR
jgi:plastocyanin